jgi:hypothetical protein
MCSQRGGDEANAASRSREITCWCALRTLSPMDMAGRNFHPFLPRFLCIILLTAHSLVEDGAMQHRNVDLLKTRYHFGTRLALG